MVVEDYTASKQQKNNDINMTKVFIYDIEKPTNPELVRIVGQEGSFTNIRKVGQTVYMVLNYSPSYWLLEESKSTELRPLAYDSIQGEDYEPIDYKDISILPGTLEGQYSIIKAIDLTSSDEKAITTKGYLGGSSGLFMSESALYLTGHKYEETVEVSDTAIFSTRDIWVPQVGDTDIYKWSVSGVNIDFVGAATVEGTVLNQYSMDEYNGYFRIATTEGSTRDEKSPSKNHLFVLNESMQVVGQINDLARGEKIYSARFMGDKAYLVTFKEVDPLFVIDVAEPTKPKVLGELKIPGFSNYLHPLDERHLIGIGYDTKVMTTEYSKEPFIVTDSMKVSLFDVSDLNNPKEKDHVLIGGRGTYSEIQHDPKALFRHEKLGLYGFPVVMYDETNDESRYLGDGALVYEITAENGITLKGNLIDNTNSQMQYEDWESTVQRIVYIGDTLFTVARGEMKSYVLESYELLDTMKIK